MRTIFILDIDKIKSKLYYTSIQDGKGGIL